MVDMADRRVVFIAYPGVQVLDVCGPGEVFAIANRSLTSTHPKYVVEIAASSPGEIVTSGGVRLVATAPLADIAATALDTLVIAGGDGIREAVHDEAMITAIRQADATARRTASVCSGAFVLTAAGLLEGKRATTHWNSCELLADLFPTITVEPDGSSCARAPCGPLRASPPASISPSRWWRRTTGNSSPPQSLGSSWCSCSVPAGSHSSASTSTCRWPVAGRSRCPGLGR